MTNRICGAGSVQAGEQREQEVGVRPAGGTASKAKKGNSKQGK
jgi:hypothetical protein